MLLLGRPLSGGNCIYRIGLGVYIWWLDALMVLIRLSAASRLPLGKLGIDPGLVIRLSQLHALDGVLAHRFPLLQSLVGAAG